MLLIINILIFNILNPVWEEDTIFPNNQTNYEIFRKPIVENALTFFPMTTVDSINWKNGIIYFNSNIDDTIIVSYLPYSNLLDTLFYYYLPLKGTTEILTSEIIQTQEIFNNNEIFIGGEKTFGIKMNENGSTELDQDLSMTFYGLVSDYWLFEGHFEGGGTNTPIPVSDLERMYIQISSPIMKSIVGDINYRDSFASAGNINNDVIGINTEVYLNQVELSGIYSENKNSSKTSVISVIFNYQGPYFFTQINSGKTVIPGSEKIYLNGKLLNNEQYSINYNYNPSITFSPDISLNNDDQIIIFYKEAGLPFRRFLQNVKISYLNNFFNSYLAEIKIFDIKNSPFGFSLSDETIDLLKRIGDSSSYALIDAGVNVGGNKGYYDKIDSIYIYRGYKQGSYNVNFTLVDSTDGDYIYDNSLPGYRWIGDGNGNYIAKVEVTPPVSKKADVFSLAFNYSSFFISTSIVRTTVDLNLFSDIQDNDNIGYAGEGKVGFTNNIVSTVFQYSVLDKYFSPLSKNTTPISIFSSYLLPSGNFFKSDNSIKILNYNSLNFNFYKLDNIEDKKEKFDIYYKYEKNYNLFNIGGSYLSKDSASSNMNFIMQKYIYYFSGETKFVFFNPSIFIKREDNTDTIHSHIYTVSSRLNTILSESNIITLSLTYKDYRVNDSLFWNIFLKTREESFLYKYSSYLNSFSIFVSRKIFSPGEYNPDFYQRFYLGKIFVNIYKNNHQLIDFTYELNRENIINKIAKYKEVEEGTGDYSYDSVTGQYYPDIYGKYIRIWEETQEIEPITKITTYLNINPVFSNLGIDFKIKAEEKTRYENIFNLLYFDNKYTLSRDYTISGFQILNTRLYYKKDNIKIYTGFIFDKSLNNQSNMRNKIEKFRLFTGFKSLNKNHFDIYLYRETMIKKNLYDIENTNCIEYYIKALYGRKFGSFEPFINLEYLTADYSNYLGYSNLGSFNQNYIDISTGISNSGKLRLYSLIGIKITSYSIDNIPPELSASSYPGTTYHWKIFSVYNINKFTNFNLNYQGEKRVDNKTYQELSAGISLIF